MRLWDQTEQLVWELNMLTDLSKRLVLLELVLTNLQTAAKINKRRRYSSYRKCVARVSWGHALSVGIQHTTSIGLAVNIYFYFLHFMYKLFHYFSG